MVVLPYSFANCGFEHGPCGWIDEPQQFSVFRRDELRRKLLRLVRAFEDRFEGRSFVRAGDHEEYQSSAVYDGRGHGDAVGVKLADPIAHHEATIIVQSLGAGEEGKCVALVAHAEEDEIEARALTGGKLEL